MNIQKTSKRCLDDTKHKQIVKPYFIALNMNKQTPIPRRLQKDTLNVL